MTTNLERRFADARVDVRLRSEGEARNTIGGYASAFNKRSDDLGGFYEIVDPTCFNEGRGRGFPGVVALYNHDQNLLLGTTQARTLRVDTDKVGLAYDVDLPNARGDLYELVQRGDVNKSSFAFRVVGEDGDHWEMDKNGLIRRTLLNVQLFDVSPVNTPAYQASSVGLRAAEVAFRSLAAHMSADPADVLAAAKEQELRRFFKRSDQPSAKPQTSSAAAALSLVLSKAKPSV